MARYTALVAIAGTLFLGAAGFASARKPAPAPANGPAAQIARGDKIFQTNCAACHGHGSGGDDYLTGEHWKYLPGTLAIYVKYQNAVPPALEDRTDLTHEVIEYYVRNGISIMPQFRKTVVSDQDLKDLSAYLMRNNGRASTAKK